MDNTSNAHNPSEVRASARTAQVDAARHYSWDAMRQASPNREARAVWATTHGVSLSLVEKWARPFGGLMDTGRRNPAARLADAIHGSVAVGVPIHDALAPVAWVARRFGYRLAVRGGAVEVDPAQVVADIARHSGDLAAYLAEALADDVLDIEERRGSQNRLERCIRAYLGAEAVAEVGVQ